ncbi:cell growth-regulating nucleolar protein [Lingula anatina]|uniref:Cell growth-regulating nucleolar protein n=1 Tax=Lingula anatina TaxID=7574 RepID=A0A1S3J691_LINAN|nr:cell growth-regulating nucleolar protein [Lingula anatina]XP_013405910.1 cell growth-regulating nucleolar protein [Lingula anatina]XP_013405911.1 cell growth-regulating nucleolar protein [Lingula anatina]|eukprot:XP_013405909.1 cell growth-regulating nucleolar protein [Lingula anatina]
MVFFTCNACGESLKKNQVEKHYMTKCRNCEVLSCVDCGKDFWGEAYQEHVKCISEEEKYSGKNYKPKPGTNKGEVKQEQWTQQVQEAIDKASANPKLRNLLIRMKDYANIPRKQAKFENFVRNSLRVSDNSLIKQVWDILLSEKNKNEKESENGTPKPSEAPSTIVVGTGNGTTQPHEQEQNGKKKKKSAEKERKRGDISDTETNNFGSSDSVNDIECSQNGEFSLGKHKKKKKKKRKQEELDDKFGISENGKSKRMKSCTETENTVKLNDTLETDDLLKKGKFKWEDVICQVLSAATDQELSLKKLRKKVLAEYSSYDNNKPEDRILAKFEKKVRKNPRLKMLQDRVKLVS